MSLSASVVDAKNQHTSVEGIWAAGDCTDELYHQNNIAAGDAVKALEDIYFWVYCSRLLLAPRGSPPHVASRLF
jgi:thioredoxin reductase